MNMFAGARQVFDRWTEWEPAEQAWLTYIKFELRYKEIDRARKIYEKFVSVHPDIRNWIKFARYYLIVYAYCAVCCSYYYFINGMKSVVL